MYNQVIAGAPLVSRIVDEMNRIKQDPGRRRLFMKYELDLMDARSEGLAEGNAHQQAEDIKLTAQLLHSLGITKNEILRSLSDTYQLSTTEAEHLPKTGRIVAWDIFNNHPKSAIGKPADDVFFNPYRDILTYYYVVSLSFQSSDNNSY